MSDLKEGYYDREWFFWTSNSKLSFEKVFDKFDSVIAYET